MVWKLLADPGRKLPSSPTPRDISIDRWPVVLEGLGSSGREADVALAETEIQI